MRDYTVATAQNLESMLKSAAPVIFALLVAIATAIWWNPLTALFALALRNEQYTHILLVLPISTALLFLYREPPAEPSVLNVVVGSTLLLIALIARVGTVWIEI